MTQHTTPHPAAPRVGDLPATVWLPAPDEPNTAPIPGAVLPAWALDKIRTDFVGHSDDQPAPLLKIAIRNMAPGADARIPTTRHTTTAEQDSLFRPRVLLAELHPRALPAPAETPVPEPSDAPGAAEDGWPGFFHRTHRLLPADGLLLLATRQRRDGVRLTHPLGTLIAAARTAGFRYLQHIVVAYAHPAADRLNPTPPTDAGHGVTHADLLAFTAIHHQ